MKDLSNRVVVITGAGSGIGRATALRFARIGSRLHLVDVDGAAVEAVRDEAEVIGARATAHVVDCRDADATARLAESVLAEPEGRVDVLHNNAGVCVGGPTETLTLDDWHHAIDLNLWGVVHGVRAFLPAMIERGEGHIVNTASMAGLVGLPMVVPYCTTKAAVVSLSESLDIEVAGRGVRVSAICPGATRTNVMRDGRLGFGAGTLDRLVNGLDRFGADPDRVARLVVQAVRRERTLVPTGLDMLPLYWLRRLSVGLYQGLWRAAVPVALRGRVGR